MQNNDNLEPANKENLEELNNNVFNGLLGENNPEEKAEELENKLESEKDVFKLVNEIIPLAIKKAEETPLISGATKKLLAMSEILLNCEANNISFAKYQDFISEQIEALIEFSKTINKRKE